MSKVPSWVRLIVRIILSPLVLAFTIITSIFADISIVINFIKNGGEFIAYKENTKQTVFECFKFLEQIKNNPDEPKS